MSIEPAINPDHWARWVLEDRRGLSADEFRAYGERVLRKARQQFKIGEGDVLLDVGTGAGLIALATAPLVGERGRVIFSDVSSDLLEHCRAQAEAEQIGHRCQFLRAPADDLSELAAASVDVLTVKAVLIYVADKPRAFREFYRVLRPKGRLYVEEPIGTFAWPEADQLFWGYDITPLKEIAEKVRAVYQRLQPPGSDPMFDFDERTLMRLADEVGFARIELELQALIDRNVRLNWEVLWAGTSGNPRIPTLKEAVREALTPAEADEFAVYLRRQVETKAKTGRSARAYLWAIK